MRIKVLFFAQLREIAGMSEQKIELEEGVTVGEVVRGCFYKGAIPILCAVNEKFVNPDEKLRDGDTLALMTPVAGG